MIAWAVAPSSGEVYFAVADLQTRASWCRRNDSLCSSVVGCAIRST